MSSNGKRMVKEDLIKKLENIPEGLEVVEANSTDEATETLSKLTVGDIVYAVPQGGETPHLYVLIFDIEDVDISESSFSATDDYIAFLCPYAPELENNMVNLKTLARGSYYAIQGSINYSGTRSDVQSIYSDGNGNLTVYLANDEGSTFGAEYEPTAYLHQIF